MGKKEFAYDPASPVTMAQAKWAQRVVVTIKSLKWGVPSVLVLGSLIFMPLGPMLVLYSTLGVSWCVWWLISNYDNVAYEYEKLKKNLEIAKHRGVRDE